MHLSKYLDTQICAPQLTCDLKSCNFAAAPRARAAVPAGEGGGGTHAEFNGEQDARIAVITRFTVNKWSSFKVGTQSRTPKLGVVEGHNAVRVNF